MAKYTFVRFRYGSTTGDARSRLHALCEMLTPEEIRGDCIHVVDEWPDCPGTFYAVQNSLESRPLGKGTSLVTGWISDLGPGGRTNPNPDSDGSYAVIKAKGSAVSFFTDQFGSRTLWYYLDERMLVVSTSQRAVVRIKGTFALNRESIAWFLSSGCQGPFMSWDADVRQVEPPYEYAFDATSWTLRRRHKDGMSLTEPSSQRLHRYLQFYKEYTADALKNIVCEGGHRNALLPLSGGLDSRLLLALARLRDVDDRVDLVNWGVVRDNRHFDDKAASVLVAKRYGKDILNAPLPPAPVQHDLVLDRFTMAGDCRVDHFNAYTDAFSMWCGFHKARYTVVVRGDIPFTEGIDVGMTSARAHIGLSSFGDYRNAGDYHLGDYPALQKSFQIERMRGESLIRWRDRLYVSWRVPMVISAFADLISGYIESRSPMMSWMLFSRYMGLPDTDKGNKKHIEILCRALDQSGVSFDATTALLPMAAAFENSDGRAYLSEYLAGRCDRVYFTEEMTASVLTHIGRSGSVAGGAGLSGRPARAAISWLSSRLPSKLKGHLKAKRPRQISAVDLGYRIVLADKAIKMYTYTAKAGQQTDCNTVR